MRSGLTQICLALGTILATVPADAAEIFRADSFAIAGSPGFASTGFPGFDPTLGTLDKVVVSLSGTLQINTTLLPFSAVTPIIAFDAVGLGGKGFEFAGAGARFLLPALTNPTAQPLFQSLTEPFSLDFKFTALNDLTGFALANVSGPLEPPSSVSGQRADFVSDFGVLEQMTFTPLTFAPELISGSGTIFVTFEFTPADPVTVPEPAPLMILSFGVAAVARARAHHHRQASPSGTGGT